MSAVVEPNRMVASASSGANRNIFAVGPNTPRGGSTDSPTRLARDADFGVTVYEARQRPGHGRHLIGSCPRSRIANR